MRTLIQALLLIPGIMLHAEETSPAPAATSASTVPATLSNAQKSLADLEAQWAATLARDALAPCAAEMEKVCQKYVANIDGRMAEARKAGALDAVLLWQKEKDNVASTKQISAEDHPNDPAALKQLRAAGRSEMIRLAATRAEKTKTILARYDAALSQAQVTLTQRGQIEEALLVKARREDLAARGLPGSREALAAAPEPAATPVVQPGLGFRFAKVEVEGARLLPLINGEKLWSDRNVLFRSVPSKFEGFKFTQFPAFAKTIRFKVTSDGAVNLCVPEKWWNPRPSDAGKDHRTEAKLVNEGWVRKRGDELGVDSEKWVVFSRQCRAGEQFSISTAKYSSPILIYK
jgi:hypothetical protein